MRFLFLSLLLLLACTRTTQTPEQTLTYSGLGKDSLSPSTLQKYAPTRPTVEMTRRIESLMDIQQPGMGIVTSDGEHMFFGWRVTGTQQIWRVDGPMRFPIQMTGGADTSYVHGVTADDRYIVISRDRNGEETPGLYLMPVKGGDLIQVQHKKGIQTHFEGLSSDGSFLYYRSNDISPQNHSLYRYELESGKKALLLDDEGYWVISDIRDDQDQILVSKFTSNVSSEHYVLQLSTKTLEPIIGQNERENYRVMFAEKPGEFIVLTNKFENFRRLYLLNKEGLKPLTPKKEMDVDFFTIDPSRRRIVYHWNNQGYTRLEAMDAQSYEPIKLPEFEGAEHVYTAGFSANGRFMTIGTESALSPRVSYLYDWESGSYQQWSRPSFPEINLSEFSPTSLEYYPARDGTKIPMLVNRAKKCAADPCPVIVSFHGGPEAQSRPGFIPIYQLFTQAGFHFVRPNVRGSSGFGKAWVDADNIEKRLDVITDIEDAALFIKKNWGKEGREPKVGVTGGSYGGYSTLIAMTKFAGAYDAGVSVVGMSNLVTFLENTAPYRRGLRISEYGDPKTDQEILLKLSPVSYVDRVQDPIMIVQGVSDPRVPVGEAVQIHKILKQKGVESELILFSDEGHGIRRRSNRVIYWGNMLRFFEEHLLEP